MNKYVDIEQIKEVIRTEWVKYMPSDLDINLSFVLGKIAEVPTIEVSEDCISRDWLEQEIEKFAMSLYKDEDYWKGWNEALEAILAQIELAPSVVPKTQIETQNLNENSKIDIVHCAECKYWNKADHICKVSKRYKPETMADHFCSYGERIDNE